MQTGFDFNLRDVLRQSYVVAFLLSAALCLAPVLRAQTAGTNQTAAPGAQNRTGTSAGCVALEPNSAAANTADANCPEPGPNFATPSAGVPVAIHPRPIISIVRVDAAVPKPPVAMPPGDTFNQVGSVTMVKTRRETLDACLASGKRWSARSSAASSTTCLNEKGDVMAFQECKISGDSPGCTVVMAQDASR